MSYKIKILENALSTWKNQETRNMIGDIVALKTEGYGRAFNDYLLVIPLDVFEFVGTHILLYKNDKLVMGYKSVSLNDCVRMNLDFPLNGTVNSSGSIEHKAAYFDFLKKNKDKRISYDCHLTVSNMIASDALGLYECLSILYALVYYFRCEYHVDYTFMLGTFFAGTHKTFKKMGAKIFADLRPIRLSTYDKKEALIMLCDRSFSERTIEYSKVFELIWKERDVVSSGDFGKMKSA